SSAPTPSTSRTPCAASSASKCTRRERIAGPRVRESRTSQPPLLMADLSSLLGPVLQGPALQQISRAIGADEQQTRTAATAALPLLLGQMQRNASTPQGAQSLDQALERDHDGGLLDGLLGGGGGLGGLLGGLLGGASGGPAPSRAADGAGILGHVFGQRQEPAAEGVARAAGLDRGQALKLMAMLAPLVMAWL